MCDDLQSFSVALFLLQYRTHCVQSAPKLEGPSLLKGLDLEEYVAVGHGIDRPAGENGSAMCCSLDPTSGRLNVLDINAILLWSGAHGSAGYYSRETERFVLAGLGGRSILGVDGEKYD